jgi:hypothetical protein
MSQTLLSLAGFQVILIGRFWVIAEALHPAPLVFREVPHPSYSFRERGL